MNDEPSGAQTLDAIFRVNARRQPEAPALWDPPDRSAFTDGAPRRLTYAAADAAAAAFARRIGDLGLPAGTVVGLQMPNTVESAVAMLGLMRAGLVPAPMPLLWRQEEMARALTAAGARALLVCGRVGATSHAEIALHAAAETFGIRFVCGFGAELPDGIVPLDDIWDDAGESPAPMPPAETAMLTFAATTDGPRPIARSHTEWLVGGLAVALEAELARQGTILGTMLPASFAGLAATFVPWLLTGGLLALHQPFDPALLAAQLAETPEAALVVPGPVLAELPASARQVLALWRAPQQQAADPPRPERAVTDILAFAETGVLPLRRGADGAPARFRTGTRRAEGAAVLALSLSPAGTLALGGPMVPAALRVAGDVDTGLVCHADAEGFLTLGAPAPEPRAAAPAA